MQEHSKGTALLTKVLWAFWVVCLLGIFAWPGDRATGAFLALGALFGVVSLSCWFLILRQLAGLFAHRTQEEMERGRRVARGIGAMAALPALGLVIGALVGGDSIGNAAAMSLLGLGLLVLLLGLSPVLRMMPGWGKAAPGALALEKGLYVVGIGFGFFAALFGGMISPKGLDDPSRVFLALVLSAVVVVTTALGLRAPRTQAPTGEDAGNIQPPQP